MLSAQRNIVKGIALLITTVLCLQHVSAKPELQSGKRYNIVCSQFPDGCVADGGTVGQPTPLYYVQQRTGANETYWTFEEVQTGLYVIRNAATQQYITYDGVREDIAQNGMLRRYVTMTDNYTAESMWTLQYYADGVYAIRNAAVTDHLWDVRVDSYCVGTYARTDAPNENQRFSIYDADGNIVTEQIVAPVETKGIEVSTWLNTSTESMEKWSSTGGWFLNTGAGGAHYNQETGANLVAPFVENWHDSRYGPLSDGQFSQTVTNLPAGSYTLQADMMAVRQAYSSWGESQPNTPAYGVTLFAGNNTVEVATGNDPPQTFKLDFALATATDMEIGVKIESTNANWVAIDNLRLFYNGTESALIEAETERVRNALLDFYTDSEAQALIDACNGNFQQLEQLRLSVATLPKKDPIAKALDSLTIGGSALAYCQSIDCYLVPIKEEDFGQNYTANISYVRRGTWGELLINSHRVSSGTDFTFQNVKAGKTYTLAISNSNGQSVTKRMTFTSVPVVKIYGDFNDAYNDGHIAVYEPNANVLEMLDMKAKWRGGITNNSDKHKRNYHVKLKDAEGNKLERKFFGLRNDNSWILEACQVDMSRIRNRVLTDLWNDYSTPPYYSSFEPKAKTGTRGNFVELILNDEYRGIYCMTENLDRKEMKLKKYDETTETVHGQLWKSKEWSYATMMGTHPDGGYYPKDFLSDPNGQSDMWDKFQVKYPDIDDVTPTDWSTLYNAVDFVCHSTDADFSRNFSMRFDLPVVIDYYILMETILATDNHGKNMFFACYDKQTSPMITFAVWDMDATSGQRWSDSYYHWNGMQPEQDYSEYITHQEHGDYNLFKRLRDTDAENFSFRTRMRYRNLRKTYLATESILDRFRTYFKTFSTGGVDQREYARWNGDSDISGLSLDFENEMEYLTDWFTRRMNYLDNVRFDIASLPTDIDDATIASSEVTPTEGGLIVTTDSESIISVYTIGGQIVRNVKLHRGNNLVTDLSKGIYVVAGKKVIVK